MLKIRTFVFNLLLTEPADSNLKFLYGPHADYLLVTFNRLYAEVGLNANLISHNLMYDEQFSNVD